MLKQVGSLMLKLMAMVLTVMFVIILKLVCFAPDIFSQVAGKSYNIEKLKGRKNLFLPFIQS